MTQTISTPIVHCGISDRNHHRKLLNPGPFVDLLATVLPITFINPSPTLSTCGWYVTNSPFQYMCFNSFLLSARAGRRKGRRRSFMGFVFYIYRDTTVRPEKSFPDPEDQQRINTFSKLNNRVRSLEEKLSVLKVKRLPPNFPISLSLSQFETFFTTARKGSSRRSLDRAGTSR